MIKIILPIFIGLVTLGASAQLRNRLDLLKVNDLISKKLKVESTTSGSTPCPSMTQTQRDAIASPEEGQCIYNSTAKTLNIYDGDLWVEVAGGGDGGISKWESGKRYEVDSVVIEGTDIYICTEEHTSGVAFDAGKFSVLAQDLSSAVGVLSMAKGGTEKSLAPTGGGIVYTDSDSMEVLSAGSSGKFLKSNGTSAPSWDDVPADPVNDTTFTGVLSLGKGGTNKALIANDGAIAYSDSDSLELLAPGSSGQVLQSNGAAAPSFVNKSISAKSESSSAVTLEEIQVPNSLLTQTATNKHLIETGNSNILANPSFEHSTASTGWTASGCSVGAESSVVISGAQSLAASCSSQTLGLYQDSALYAAQLSGVQGVASIKVRTTVAGVKVCTRKNGVRSTTECLDVQNDGKWQSYKIPTTFTNTSNGIEVFTAGNVTGNIYVDDAFVGVEAINSTIVQRNATACTSVACQTEFTAIVTSAGVVSGENVDWINGNCGYSGNVSTCNFSSSIFSASPTCLVTPQRGIHNAVGYLQTALSSTSVAHSFLNQTGTGVALNYFIACQRSGADYRAALAAQSAHAAAEEAAALSLYSTNNGATIRAGMVYATSKTTCDPGSILANGAALSRTDYAQLFAAIGTTHGAGNGSTTFNIPDYRGRFLRGRDGGAARDPDRASRTAMNAGGNTGDNVGSVQGPRTEDLFTPLTNVAGNIRFRHEDGFPSWNPTVSTGAILGVNTAALTSATPIYSRNNGTETRPVNAYVNYCVYTQDSAIVGSFKQVDDLKSDFNSHEANPHIKAWVNFNGTNGAIRASQNVTSVIRHGTGEYTINFTTAMKDANYAVVGSARRSASDTNIDFAFPLGGTYSTTAVRVRTQATTNFAVLDGDIVNVIITR
jgi:hypothetical protein